MKKNLMIIALGLVVVLPAKAQWTIVMGISKTKPRMRHLINVKEPHFFHFEA